MLRAFHPPGRVPELGGDSPQGHKQPAPLRQSVIAGGRPLTLRAPPAPAAMRLQAYFDRTRLALMTLQPNLLIHKPGKVLHPVQNRLNLELNSWSPRSIVCFLDNRRLIEPLEISYFVFACLPKRRRRSCGKSAKSRRFCGISKRSGKVRSLDFST